MIYRCRLLKQALGGAADVRSDPLMQLSDFRLEIFEQEAERQEL
jgi:hypothetical protein